MAEATGGAASFFCCFFVVFVAGAHKAGVVGTAAVSAARCAQSSRVEFVVDMTGWLGCLELVWWGKGKKAQLRMVLCDGGTNPFMTNRYIFTRGSSKPPCCRDAYGLDREAVPENPLGNAQVIRKCTVLAQNETAQA